MAEKPLRQYCPQSSDADGDGDIVQIHSCHDELEDELTGTLKLEDELEDWNRRLQHWNSKTGTWILNLYFQNPPRCKVYIHSFQSPESFLALAVPHTFHKVCVQNTRWYARKIWCRYMYGTIVSWFVDISTQPQRGTPGTGSGATWSPPEITCWYFLAR